MPFTDDLGVSALSSLLGRPFLLSVFASPERFRAATPIGAIRLLGIFFPRGHSDGFALV